METFVLQDISIQLTKEELCRSLRLPAELDADDAARIEQMVAECSRIANPKAVYGVAAIEEKGEDWVKVEGRKIVSPLVRKNLDRVNRIVPFVTTCGTEAEEWSKRYTDVLEGYWADGIKLLLLGKIRRALAELVKERFFPGSDMSAMSPGSLIEWPLVEQQNLFALIGGVTETIGVELTESCLMLPSKSSSGFFFTSETHYENCTLCPILTCPNRRAPYAPS